MEKFIKLLKPYKTNSSKIRLGPPEDGGYVCTEDMLEKCSSIMTYGVGHDIRYEEDFIKRYNKQVYLFDHTIGRSNWSKENIEFISEGLGIQKDSCKEWFEHKNELGIEGKVLLKVDIEGGEFEYFNNTDISKLAEETVGIFLEIHWVDNKDNREAAIGILEKLKNDFVVCHIHGNNWGGLFKYNDVDIPKVLELTFVNKDILTSYEQDSSSYPIVGIDIPNNPKKEDYQLNFLDL